MAEREPELTGADASARIYEAKALAELGDADALLGAVPRGWTGKAQASVALVAGRPLAAGEGIAALGEALADALAKALAALGADAADAFVISSRPVRGASPAAAARRLALAIEAVDPALVLALDDAAAADLSLALCAGTLTPGEPVRSRGRVVGSVGDFGASLSSPEAKSAVWTAMRRVAAEAGLKAKGRPKAPRTGSSEPAVEKD